MISLLANLNIFILFLNLFFPAAGNIYVSILRTGFVFITMLLVLTGKTSFFRKTLVLSLFGIAALVSFPAAVDMNRNIESQANILWMISFVIFLEGYLDGREFRLNRQNMLRAMLLIYILYMVFSVFSRVLDNTVLYGFNSAVENPAMITPQLYQPELLSLMMVGGLVLISFQIRTAAGMFKFMYLLLFLMTSTAAVLLSPVSGTLLVLLNLGILFRFGVGMTLRNALLLFLAVILVFTSVSVMYGELYRNAGKLIDSRCQKFLDVLKIFSGHAVFIGSGGKSFGVLSRQMKGKSLFHSDAPPLYSEGVQNTFLEILVSCGAGAFVLFGVFLVSVAADCIRHQDYLLLSTMAVFVLSSFLEDLFSCSYYPVVLFIVYAVQVSDHPRRTDDSFRKTTKTVICLLLLAAVSMVTLDSGNGFSGILVKKAHAGKNPEKLRFGLLKGLDVSPYNSEIFNDLAELALYRKDFKAAEEAVRSALKYSKFNIRSLRLRCWVSFLQGGKPSEFIESCRLIDPVDQYGVNDLLDCMIKRCGIDHESGAESLVMFVLRYPEFWKDIFIRCNKGLAESAKKLLGDKNYCNGLIRSFSQGDFMKLRLASVFFFMGDIASSNEMFATIDITSLDHAAMGPDMQKNFRKEYLLQALRLGLEEERILKEIRKWFPGIESVLSHRMIRSFQSGNYQDVLKLAERFSEIRIPRTSGVAMMPGLPAEGLYYAVLSALKLKKDQKAESIADSILNDKSSAFLGHLAKAHVNLYRGHKKLVLSELNNFWIGISGKKHLFEMNSLYRIFLENCRDWIPDRRYSLYSYNQASYIQKMLDLYAEVMNEDSRSGDLDTIRSFFSPLLKIY